MISKKWYRVDMNNGILIHKLTKEQFSCRFNLEGMYSMGLIDDDSHNYRLFYDRSHEGTVVYSFSELSTYRKDLLKQGSLTDVYYALHENIYDNSVRLVKDSIDTKYLLFKGKNYIWTDTGIDNCGKYFRHLGFLDRDLQGVISLRELNDDLSKEIDYRDSSSSIDIAFSNIVEKTIHRIDTVRVGSVGDYYASKQSCKTVLKSYGIGMFVIL